MEVRASLLLLALHCGAVALCGCEPRVVNVGAVLSQKRYEQVFRDAVAHANAVYGRDRFKMNAIAVTHKANAIQMALSVCEDLISNQVRPCGKSIVQCGAYVLAANATRVTSEMRSKIACTCWICESEVI